MNLKIKIYLLLLSYLAIAEGAFIEMPTSQTVSVGETAEFRCRHATADTIRWRVNGTLVSISRHPVDITPGSVIEGDVLVSILTITGRPEFNGTEVICVARFDDGSPEQTTNPEAVLIVSMNVTDDSMSQTGFIDEPLSLNVTIGEEAVFRCEHRSAVTVIWMINETALSSRLDLSGDFIVEIIGRFHTLTVTALLEYNTTVVQCVALFHSGNSQPETTAPAVLQIQGAINRVDTLVRNFFTLSWKAPFSLDLTNVEPDIVYCVDVYNITCGGRELLISDCDVTETSYTSDVIAPDGYIHEYIVTPRSNVEGAVNGTPSQPLRDHLPTFIESSTRLSVGNFGRDSNVRAYQTKLTYTPSEPIPSSYSLSLDSLDGLEDMDHVETTATIEPSVLTLEVVSGLPFRRLWNCTILAFGCQENNILNDVLSTHDFRDIVFSTFHPGEVRVTGSFTDDSTATGLLVIVIGDSKVIYHKASRDGTDKIKETLITGLAGGEYNISVFVVEENGLPFERVATSPKLVAVETNDVVTPPSSSIEYSLQSTATGVCITCTFLDSSATDCVVVVHQRISQLSSSGLMNIESSHKLTRSGDTASGCIEGVNVEDYQVGVVGGRQVILQEQGSKICDGCIAGSVLAVLLFLFFVVLAVVIILIHKMKMKRRIFRSQNSDIERRLCLRTNVYEEGPNLKEHTCETTPLRVESDSPLISENREPLDLQASSILPPVTPHSAGLEPNEVVPEPTYAEPEFSKKKIISAPFADRVKYDEVNTFKNPQGQDYATVVLPSPSGQTVPDDLHKTTSEYSEILHDQYRNGENVTTKKETKTETEKCIPQCVVTPHTLYTVENIVSLLHPICSKWKDLGMVMSMDDDHLDQVFTNNEGDEACLRDLLERYMDNGDFQHNWEEIVAILKTMDENVLASDIYDLHVHPYVDSLPRETHEESELTQEESDDLLVKEPPSEGQQSLLDVGSPHRQTQEEPNLSLELMHKESELTQNEVATDNLLAKEPQPEKPPTDSEHHQDTQHEQPQPTKRHKSDSANSDESSDSGFLSGASDENQSNSSNSSESEDEESKGTKAVQPETQDLHKQAFVLGASGKILPESMKAPQLYHLSEKQVSTMQTKPSPTPPKQSRISKNDVVASNLSCDLGSEDECQTVSNRNINGCYSFGVLLPCTSYFTENYCNNSEPEDNTIEIQASQPEDEDEFLLSYYLSTSTSLNLSRDDQHRLLLLSKREHRVDDIWQKRAKMYYKTQEFEENKRLRVDNSVKKRGDSVRTQRKSRF